MESTILAKFIISLLLNLNRQYIFFRSTPAASMGLFYSTWYNSFFFSPFPECFFLDCAASDKIRVGINGATSCSLFRFVFLDYVEVSLSKSCFVRLFFKDLEELGVWLLELLSRMTISSLSLSMTHLSPRNTWYLDNDFFMFFLISGVP